MRWKVRQRRRCRNSTRLGHGDVQPVLPVVPLPVQQKRQEELLEGTLDLVLCEFLASFLMLVGSCLRFGASVSPQSATSYDNCNDGMADIAASAEARL